MTAAAQDEALRVLRLTGQILPDGRVRIPVDPAMVADKLGILTYERLLDPEVGAALVKEPNRDPVILLNERDHRNRQRFSAAHEIGHFVQRASNPNQYHYVD